MQFGPEIDEPGAILRYGGINERHGRIALSEETITLYEAIGGEATIRELVSRFYRIMDTDPAAARCRAQHPPSLERAEEKLYEYLTGYLGGPPLYTDKYGHPRLRSRHFVAEIGPAEVEEWLYCFRKAADEAIRHDKLRAIILDPIERLAHHMQNRAGDHAGQ